MRPPRHEKQSTYTRSKGGKTMGKGARTSSESSSRESSQNSSGSSMGRYVPPKLRMESKHTVSGSHRQWEADSVSGTTADIMAVVQSASPSCFTHQQSNQPSILMYPSYDSEAQAAADALGRDLEAMGYNLDCESFITKADESTVVDARDDERYESVRSELSPKGSNNEDSRYEYHEAYNYVLDSSSSSSYEHDDDELDDNEVEMDDEDDKSSTVTPVAPKSRFRRFFRKEKMSAPAKKKHILPATKPTKGNTKPSSETNSSCNDISFDYDVRSKSKGSNTERNKSKTTQSSTSKPSKRNTKRPSETNSSCNDISFDTDNRSKSSGSSASADTNRSDEVSGAWQESTQQSTSFESCSDATNTLAKLLHDTDTAVSTFPDTKMTSDDEQYISLQEEMETSTEDDPSQKRPWGIREETIHEEREYHEDDKLEKEGEHTTQREASGKALRTPADKPQNMCSNNQVPGKRWSRAAQTMPAGYSLASFSTEDGIENVFVEGMSVVLENGDASVSPDFVVNAEMNGPENGNNRGNDEGDMGDPEAPIGNIPNDASLTKNRDGYPSSFEDSRPPRNGRQLDVRVALLNMPPGQDSSIPAQRVQKSGRALSRKKGRFGSLFGKFKKKDTEGNVKTDTQAGQSRQNKNPKARIANETEANKVKPENETLGTSIEKTDNDVNTLKDTAATLTLPSSIPLGVDTPVKGNAKVPDIPENVEVPREIVTHEQPLPETSKAVTDDPKPPQQKQQSRTIARMSQIKRPPLKPPQKEAYFYGYGDSLDSAFPKLPKIDDIMQSLKIRECAAAGGEGEKGNLQRRGDVDDAATANLQASCPNACRSSQQSAGEENQSSGIDASNVAAGVLLAPFALVGGLGYAAYHGIRQRMDQATTDKDADESATKPLVEGSNVATSADAIQSEPVAALPRIVTGIAVGENGNQRKSAIGIKASEDSDRFEETKIPRAIDRTSQPTYIEPTVEVKTKKIGSRFASLSPVRRSQKNPVPTKNNRIKKSKAKAGTGERDRTPSKRKPVILITPANDPSQWNPELTRAKSKARSKSASRTRGEAAPSKPIAAAQPIPETQGRARPSKSASRAEAKVVSPKSSAAIQSRSETSGKGRQATAVANSKSKRKLRAPSTERRTSDTSPKGRGMLNRLRSPKAPLKSDAKMSAPQITAIYPIEFNDDNCTLDRNSCRQSIESNAGGFGPDADDEDINQPNRPTSRPKPPSRSRSDRPPLDPRGVPERHNALRGTSAQVTNSQARPHAGVASMLSSDAGETWAEVVQVASVLSKAMSQMESVKSDDALEQLLSQESKFGEVERAMITLKKHADALGVKESDLLIAAVRSDESLGEDSATAPSEMRNMTIGEELMEVVGMYFSRK